MAYFKSENVKVFPCAYRGQGDVEDDWKIKNPESRLNSEFNLTRSSRNYKYSDSDTREANSYIIGWKEETGGSTYTLICVISGYYFEISGLALSDFIYTNTTTQAKSLYNLYIKATDVGIITSGNDDKVKTPILVSFDGENARLDTQAGYFTGLAKLIDTDTATNSATGTLKVARWKDASDPSQGVELDESSYLPEIYSGYTQGEVIIGHKETNASLIPYLDVQDDKVNVLGDLNINTDKFNVKAATGNTKIAGTVDVDGKTTVENSLNSKSLNIGSDYSKFKVDTDGNITTDVVNTTGNFKAIKTLNDVEYGIETVYDSTNTKSTTKVKGHLDVRNTTTLHGNVTLKGTATQLYIESQKPTDNAAALKIATDGQVLNNPLETPEETEEERRAFETDNKLRFVYNIDQDSIGQVSYKSKYFNIKNGADTQGSFRFNIDDSTEETTVNDNISIYNLGTSGTPTFETITTKKIYGNLENKVLEIYTNDEQASVCINKKGQNASQTVSGTLDVAGGISSTGTNIFKSDTCIGTLDETNNIPAIKFDVTGTSTTGTISATKDLKLCCGISVNAGTTTYYNIGSHKLQLGSTYTNASGTPDYGVFRLYDGTAVTAEKPEGVPVFEINGDTTGSNTPTTIIRTKLYTTNLYGNGNEGLTAATNNYLKIYSDNESVPAIKINEIYSDYQSTDKIGPTVYINGGLTTYNSINCLGNRISSKEISLENTNSSGTASLYVGGSSTSGTTARPGYIYLYNTGSRITSGAPSNTITLAGEDGSIMALGTTMSANFTANNTTGQASAKVFQSAPGTSPAFYVTMNGDVTANSFIAPSDRRLKENIEDFKYTKSILDIPVYKYDYIDGLKNKIGCMAQDLQKICPEIVHEDENGYLKIEESKIVYLLLEELKKLNKRVKELENK